MSDDTTFYATLAQVIPTLLIVMAIEGRRLKPDPGREQAFRIFLFGVLVLTTLGETFAIIGTRLELSSVIRAVVLAAFGGQMAFILFIAATWISSAGAHEDS